MLGVLTCLATAIKRTNALLPSFKKRLKVRRDLYRERAISNDLVLQGEQDYLRTFAQVSGLEVQLKQLEVQEGQSRKEYLQNLNLIDDLKNRIQDVHTKRSELSLQELNESVNKSNQVQELERRIAQITLKLKDRSTILSPYTGKILEVGIVPGRRIEEGTRLGAIEIEDRAGSLVSVAYFGDKDGKKIKPGMLVQVTPSVVERERFGGIMAKVTAVSPFPVTTQDVAATVGNEDLANSFAKNFSESNAGAPIQVYAELLKDPKTPSGYQWSSSKGPSLKLSSGTTTSIRVRIEERAPISFLIPIFRSLTGVYD
jgi:HlyD family secretion protein